MDFFFRWIETMLQQQTSVADLLLLLGFSFLLGLTHTFGPGHGKSLMLGVLVADSRRVGHALKMALVIGITHMMDVILLSFASIFIVASFPLRELSYYIGVIAGTGIVLLGLYRMYRVYPSQSSHSGDDEVHPSRPGGGNPTREERERQNLITAFLYSLVPCPGAWVLFMACLGLGKPLYGFILLLGFTVGLLLAISGIALSVVYSFRSMESYLPDGIKEGLHLASGVFIVLLGGWLIYGAGHFH